ncbi:MAG: CDP-alcohol phosphatidyltransferase family protein [Clostridia bacterium]|nr:CDP-alcohol phosphatidyltransferase family protein [Clostridia bacterium]
MSEKNVNRYQKKIFTVPNVLSFVRLGLIPLFVWLYSFVHEFGWAIAVLALSYVTDLADGFIARKFNMMSDLGKILDPIADKLTQICVLICLVFRFPLMMIPLNFIIVKELFSGILGLVRVKKTKDVPSAVWHGKVNTALLNTTMIAHVVFPTIPEAVSNISIVICTAMMAVSAVLYGIMHFKAINKQKNSDQQ